MAPKSKNAPNFAPGELGEKSGILDECPFPIFRVDATGKTLFANAATTASVELWDAKSGKVAENLVAFALSMLKKKTSSRLDVAAGAAIYDFLFDPVPEKGYVNAYGRDVTRIRETEKQLHDAAKFPTENPNPVLRVESDGRILLANDAARAIDGLIEPGPPERVNPDMCEAAREAAENGTHEQIDVEWNNRIFLFTFTIIANESYLNVYGREITAEREAQHALIESNAQLEKRVADRTASVRLLQNIVLAANSAESFEAALQTALHEVCIFSDWTVGHAYVIVEGEAGREIRPTGIWHIGKGEQFSDLRNTTESMRFGTPDDLPGRVMAKNQAIWIEDLEDEPNFPRLEFIRRAGLVSGMAFPVFLNDKVIGVLEFFSKERADADVETVKTLGHVGTQLGSVAERKRAEFALQESQKEAATAHVRLMDAVEAMGQALCLFDADDRTVLFNKRYSDLYHTFTNGLRPKIGDPFETGLRRSAVPMHGFKSETEAEGWIQRVLKNRKANQVRLSTDQMPDGRWYQSEGFPTRDGGTVSIFTDITEAKLHEAELAKETELAHTRLMDAIEAMGQGFVLYDKDDRVVLHNQRVIDMFRSAYDAQAFNVGNTFEQILRSSKNERRGFASDEEREAWIQRVLKSRRDHEVRNSVDTMPDGIVLRSEGFATQEGGIVSVFTDITEEKKHEAELDELVAELGVARDAAVQANAAKSQFLANMSHELRTPLNAIIGYAELLVDDVTDDGNEDYIDDLQKIQNAGKHLLGLINDILDLSKIEVGKIDVFVEEFPVDEMLKDVAQTIKPLVDKNNNVLEVKVDKNVGSIHSDLTKVRQNLFNLLSNAAKFTSDGKLTLSVKRRKRKAGDLIAFDVTDQGIGMDEAQLAKVFDPFTQADSSTSKRFGGTGLGLTITREFTRMLGGDIAVKSKLGKGTTFTMTIAADARPDDADDEPSAGILARTEVSPDAPLILIIDDEPSVRELLQRNLAAAGYRTEVAKNGKEGLRMAHQLAPAAITLDVIMPQTDGWTVLSELKSDPHTASIPVIMVTITEDRGLGFSLGASDYLSKPVDRKKLISVLDRFLGETKGRTVLLVEDDDDTRTIMRKYLENEGAVVVQAENGRVGLERMADSAPAMVLLDLMMPEMDGFGFVEAYRGKKEWHGIPIVVVTAKTLTKAEREKLDGWVEGFYSKLDTSIDVVLANVCAMLPPPSKDDS